MLTQCRIKIKNIDYDLSNRMNLPNSHFEQKTHILVIDDDERIRKLLNRYLTKEGFLVTTAEDAVEAKAVLKSFSFDILIIDVMMPGQDGVDLTRELKQNTHTPPIILLTALGEVEDRIKGFENGADDYLPKPFEPKELKLRIDAITRRVKLYAQNAKDETDYVIGPWIYSPRYSTLRQETSEDDTSIKLTSGENTLLKVLAQNYGQILNREQLAEMSGVESGERTIDVQVTRLRRKIEEVAKDPKNLQTIRGKGYVLYAEPIN